MKTPAQQRYSQYDEALERFHATGPEFDGSLSNHGPMVIEAMSRRGMGTRIHPWVDRYAVRLDERPRGVHPIDAQGWRDPLGDATRTGDWIDLMTREVAQRPWPETLARWWPRLVPGIAAGATHGVIRVGHVVQALRAEVTGPRLTELAQALAYWAARWQPVPIHTATGHQGVREALAAIPAVADQRFGIRHRFAQLGDTPGWARAQADRRQGVDPAVELDHIVDAAVSAYVQFAPGEPTMLVHAATAPAAVARVLPSLPPSLWATSLDAAWAATTAVIAAYRPATPVANPTNDVDPWGPTLDEAWAAAVEHGGEHVIKLADTALTSSVRTGTAVAVAATVSAIRLDA